MKVENKCEKCATVRVVAESTMFFFLEELGKISINVVDWEDFNQHYWPEQICSSRSDRSLRSMPL